MAEKVFYAKTIINFIKDTLEIDDSIDNLCKQFGDHMITSDVHCPAYKKNQTCNKKSSSKNIYKLCNYHYVKFIQNGSILVEKKQNIYCRIYFDKSTLILKKCKYPKCKIEIEGGIYCIFHSDCGNILCNKVLINGNMCKNLRCKDDEGNRLYFCKKHKKRENNKLIIVKQTNKISFYSYISSFFSRIRKG